MFRKFSSLVSQTALYGLLLEFFSWMILEEILQESAKSLMVENIGFTLICLILSLAGFYFLYPAIFLLFSHIRYRFSAKNLVFTGTILSLKEIPDNLSRTDRFATSPHHVSVQFTDHEDTIINIMSEPFLFFREQALKDVFLSTYKTVRIYGRPHNGKVFYQVDLTSFHQAFITYRWFHPWAMSNYHV